MYDKVARFSLKSLTETNSGKLVTIISGDMFQVERAISLTPMIAGIPFILVVAMTLIAINVGLLYTFYIFLLFVAVITAQMIVNNINIRVKMRESI
jgi:ABC-type multidrug transport system fused ATPase/permease subunit